MKLLSESQCGFRKGQGCDDMTFTIRQILEKTVEYWTKQFFHINFVDLRKAYDSVLGKFGVQEVLIKL